uniref:Uncharacterized protein n=1 Tax=Candidatus Kentrum sp. DK TaxID=2126562 RepID=A0A450RY25_9GAMM|nr:MAG: hypothetical protein BECKDK2373C_GA0170839_100733 [Candidatus Kentron sp. DK]
MKNPLSKMTFFFMMAFIFGTAHGQDMVDITSPNNGDEVGATVIVKGTSDIGNQGNVWVLLHVKALSGQWWPQNKPYRDPATGNWEALVYFGGPQDIDSDFEIAVATFTGEAEKEILKYHEHGRKTKHYPPMSFPETTSDIKKIIVTKISH